LADRLKADGLILREALDGDRRVTVAKLTRRGGETFAEMARAHDKWPRELMADVRRRHARRGLDAACGGLNSGFGRRATLRRPWIAASTIAQHCSMHVAQFQFTRAKTLIETVR
jgi:hypothetical protein